MEGTFRCVFEETKHTEIYIYDLVSRIKENTRTAFPHYRSPCIPSLYAAGTVARQLRSSAPGDERIQTKSSEHA